MRKISCEYRHGSRGARRAVAAIVRRVRIIHQCCLGEGGACFRNRLGVWFANPLGFSSRLVDAPKHHERNSQGDIYGYHH